MKRTRNRLLAGLAAATAAFLPWPALAQGITIVPKCASTSGTFGNAPPVPQLSCMLELFGNIAQLILGVTGSFALLMFVYGGFMMVIAGGQSARFDKAKVILRNAVIGILIIMCSGIVLRYALQKLSISNDLKVIGQPCSKANSSYLWVQQTDGSIKCEVPPKQ